MTFIAAQDNLSFLETMRTGDPALKPGPAARAFYSETVRATFANPAARNAFLNNAWNLWRPLLTTVREWDSPYIDKLATRRTEWGATAVTVDAHGIPQAVQANPNDAQNELRFKKYRAAYEQATLRLNRDEYTPITIDPISVGRLMAEGPDSSGASEFMGAQIRQMLNADRAREFNTLMDSFGRFVIQPGLFYTNTPDLDPATITPAEAQAAAVAIRAAVKNLADFTNTFSPAKVSQTVPEDQVRLVISVSAWAAIGLGYATAFNPEYIIGLPDDQIVVIPDQYFASRPEFAGTDTQWALIDAGSDLNGGGTFIVIDSLYEMGADPFVITGTTNQALHHASILDLNPFRTLILGGPGEGTSMIDLTPVPESLSFSIYTDQGVIADGGDLPRGVEFSTTAKVVDALGNQAGGYSVTITGNESPLTEMLRYANGKVSEEETADEITVTVTSLIDPSISESQTFTLTGQPRSLMNGALIVTGFEWPGVFDPGTGTGGTYTYTAADGVVYTVSDGVTVSPLGASPAAVASGETVTFIATAASGYVFADGTTVKEDGPHTAA